MRWLHYGQEQFNHYNIIFQGRKVKLINLFGKRFWLLLARQLPVIHEVNFMLETTDLFGARLQKFGLEFWKTLEGVYSSRGVFLSWQYMVLLG